jgi:tetratricopeptide (TPR) repeat protein
MSHINRLLGFKNLKEDFLNELLILKATVHSKFGEDEKAFEIYEGLTTKKVEELHEIYHNIGRILIKSNRNEEGLKYLNEAIRIQLKLQSPETTHTLDHIGQLYKDQGNYREALIYFENAIINARQFNQLKELSELYSILLEIFKLSGSIANFEKYIVNLINDIDMSLVKSKFSSKLILVLNSYLLSTSQIERCMTLTNSFLKASE